MTMIAATTNFGFPVLIGDLLISSTAGNVTSLPGTILDIAPFLERDQELIPVRLHRKVYFPASNLSIALAGSVNEMKNFLTELTQRCKYYDVMSKDALELFLNDYPLKTQFKESSAILVLMDSTLNETGDHKTLIYRYGNWVEDTSPVFENIMATGSGSQEFVHQAMEKMTVKNHFTQPSVFEILSCNINLVCKIAGAEHISLYNLRQHWGGGFEIAYFNGESFEFVDEVTYLFCNLTADKDGNIGAFLPDTVMYYKYHGEDLCINSFKVIASDSLTGHESIVVKSVELMQREFMVVPITSAAVPADKQNATCSFVGTKLAVCFNVIIDDLSGFFNPTLFIEYADASISFDSNTLTTVFPTAIYDMIKQQIKDLYPGIRQGS